MRNRFSWLGTTLILVINVFSAYHDSLADEWENFKARYGNNFFIRWDKKLDTTPRLLYGQGIAIGNKNILTDDNIAGFAYAFIATNKDFFRVELGDIRFKSIKHIRDNWSVKFQQYYKNIPVEGSVIGISISDRGFVNLIGSGYYPDIEANTIPKIDSVSAINIARNQYTIAEQTEAKIVTPVILPVESSQAYEFHLAWRIELQYNIDISASKVFFVDASSGKILKAKNVMARNSAKVNAGINGNVKGHVWLTGPDSDGNIPPSTIVPYPRLVVKLYGTQYQTITDDDGNYTLPQGEAGIDQVYSTFENSDIKVIVYPTAPPSYSIDEYLSVVPSWTWADITNHGDEYNVFYWLNFMHDYFLNNFAYDIWGTQQVVANLHHPYLGVASAAGYMIAFPLGHNTPKDKITISHEYTHNIESDLNVPFDYSNESGAFCEGAAAYIASSIHNDPVRGGEFWPLNSTDAPYYYEDYINYFDPHYNGAIIGKAMWTFRTQLGDAIQADGLILEAFNILSNFPDTGSPNARIFSDFVTALLIADDNDPNPVNGTPHQSTILNSFGTHHIYPSGYIVSGNISGNTTWQANTYITGNLTINSGVTLTIASGVTVTINPGVAIYVEGALSIASGATITGGGTIVKQGSGAIFVTNSTTALASNNSRKLARDSNGNYHLVFETVGEVCYEKLTSSGAITEFRRLSNGLTDGVKSHPSIYVRDNNIYVVWQKNTGSSHDITVHKSTDYGATWQTSNRKVPATNVGANPPLPVIVSPATNQLMIVYRTATNLSYQTSSNNGSTWSTKTAVPSSGAAGNSPNLAVTPHYWNGYTRTVLVNAATGGNGAIFYRYYINDPDSTGWAASLLKNLSIIVPGTYTGHKSPSLAPSGSSGSTYLHVAWEANSGSHRVIIHRKANSWVDWPNVYSVTYYFGQQLPSITGLSYDTAELLFQYDASNIIYKMHYGGTYWGGPVSVGDGFNPSVSVGNTTAKYVWTSGSAAPYQIQTSTETLSKTQTGAASGKQLATVYHRSIAVIDTTTGNWLEVRLDKLAVKTKSGEEFAVPFAEAKEDANSLTPANAFANLASSWSTLPADAESLFVRCQVNGQGLSAIKSRATSINVEIALAKKNGASLRLPVITTSSESLPETKRTIAMAASSLAGGEISLRAQVSGIENKSSLIASLGHIYEVVEAPIGKTLEAIAQNATPQNYALSAYPNPFSANGTFGNPSTQIRFAMKQDGFATLRVYNLNGQLVRELLHEPRAAGEYALPWDGRDRRGVAAASGVYFIRFEAGNEVKLSKVMLVR